METKSNDQMIQTPWGKKRWAFLRQCMDSHHELQTALTLCLELLDDSDVRHFISTKLGEQARLHSALNKARSAISKAKGE